MQFGTDGVEFGFPADEGIQTGADVAGSVGSLGSGGLLGSRGGLWGQQLRVQGLQFRARVRAQVLGEGAAGLLVRGEGVRVSARVAQGADEEGVQGLVVRVRFGEFPQLRYEVCGVAQSQIRRYARTGGLLVQGFCAGGHGGAVGEVGQGGAVPQGECLA